MVRLIKSSPASSGLRPLDFRQDNRNSVATPRALICPRNRTFMSGTFLLVAIIAFYGGTTIARAAKSNDRALVFEDVVRTVDVGYYPRDFFIDFLFEARGEGAVSIRSSTSTCPCTTVATDRTVYYPGQKGVIAVIYGYRGGPGAPEPQGVRVATDRSPQAQTLQIIPRQTATGLWVDRHELRWTGAAAQSAQPIEVEVSPTLAGRIPIVDLPVAGWKASVDAMEPTGKYRITIQPTSERSPRTSARIRLSPINEPASAVEAPSNPEAAIELIPAPLPAP